VTPLVTYAPDFTPYLPRKAPKSKTVWLRDPDHKKLKELAERMDVSMPQALGALIAYLEDCE
jgi:hypothetical protein